MTYNVFGGSLNLTQSVNQKRGKMDKNTHHLSQKLLDF